MAMRTNWVEFVPFYVAKTLPPDMLPAFEAALAQEAHLQREVQEWRLIASAVWQETDHAAQQLPPLPPTIYEKLAYRRPFVGTTEGVPMPAYAAHPSRPAPRPIQLSVTLVAGVLVVLVFGALLMLAANNQQAPLEAASAATLTGTRAADTSFAAAATLTAEPIMTQLAQAAVLPAAASPTNTLAANPTLLPITPTPRPTLPVQPPTQHVSAAGIAASTPTLSPLPGLPACFVTNRQPTLIGIYDAARRDANLIGQLGMGEGRQVFQLTADQWANIFTVEGILSGWVALEDVTLGGDCLNLPQPSPTAAPANIILTAAPPETYVIVTATSAEVRSGPGLEFTVMLAAAQNDTFRLVGTTGSGAAQWFYVLLPDETQGWLWSQQASISEISGIVPATLTPLATPSPLGG